MNDLFGFSLRTLLVSACLLGSFQLHAHGHPNSLTSPDKKIEFSLTELRGHLAYQVKFNQKDLVLPSRLGMAFLEQDPIGPNTVAGKGEHKHVDQSWQQPWGERKVVYDNHNEWVVELSRLTDRLSQFQLRVRLFNDGLGFRYEHIGTGKGTISVTQELTEFNFANADSTQAWWIPGRGWNRYEYLYNETMLDQFDRAHTPITFKQADGVHVSLHEAALVDFPGMVINQDRGGQLNADLTPRSDGLKAVVKPGFVTPWRTIQISSDAIGLLNSDLILNLNEPNKLGDVSWVEPGKYLGIWWDMHIGTKTWGSGEKHGATTDYTMQMMDFAAEHGFDGVLVEGWNIGWDGDWFFNGDVFSFTESYPDFDIEAVTKHGLAKGVRLIGHHETSGNISNYEKQMQDAFALYQKHGVTQIKTGYVADAGDVKRIDENGIVRLEWHDSQHTVNHYLHNIKQAAKYKISINTHEPIKDTGLRRTYPNWISREGARGQEFNAWGVPPNSPQHTVDLTYTRMLSGPMDFTPGIFDLIPHGLDADSRIQTTLAKQLALYVVIYSPIQMAADLISNYQANMPAFQFIKDVPTDWEQSRAIAGEVGEYVVFARQERDGQDWFLGAITDENARDIDIDLGFLEAGKRYQAHIYQDGKDADWKTNPDVIDISTKKVTAKDKLRLKLATSGGTAIRFEALER